MTSPETTLARAFAIALSTFDRLRSHPAAWHAGFRDGVERKSICWPQGDDRESYLSGYSDGLMSNITERLDARWKQS